MGKIKIDEETILSVLSVVCAAASLFIKGRKAVLHDEALKASIENDVYRTLGLIEDKKEDSNE